MSSLPTRPEDAPLDDLVRARTFRRVALAILGLIVLAGLFNVLGVRRDVVAGEGGGYASRCDTPA